MICRIRETHTFKTWADEGHRRAHSFITPIPTTPETVDRGIAGAPKVAQQIYTQATLTKMCVRLYQGEAMEKTLAWLRVSSKALCAADL